MHIFLFEKALLLGKSSNKQAGILNSSNLSIVECIEKNFVTSVQNDSTDGKQSPVRFDLNFRCPATEGILAHREDTLVLHLLYQ